MYLVGHFIGFHRVYVVSLLSYYSRSKLTAQLQWRNISDTLYKGLILHAEHFCLSDLKRPYLFISVQ